MAHHDDDDDGVFATSAADDPRYEAVFEDDGEVAYGYMMCDRDIIADVWLYNVVDTPEAFPASSAEPGGTALPFLNTRRFAGTTGFQRVASDEDISFIWRYDAHGGVEAVEFWIPWKAPRTRDAGLQAGLVYPGHRGWAAGAKA